MIVLDATLTHVDPDRAFLAARAALCGLGLPASDEQPLFDTVDFQIGGLTELSGVAPVKAITTPQRLTDPDATFAMVWNPDSSQTWTGANGDTVDLDYAAQGTLIDAYQHSVSTAPHITVTGSARNAAQWMRDYVYPLHQITSFATARDQPICWVSLSGHEGDRRFRAQLFGPAITQEPYDAQAPTPGLFTTLFRLGRDGIALTDLLAGWQALQSRHPTFFEVFAGYARQQDRSLRSMLLLFVPALEGYHYNEHGKWPVTKAEHRARRKALLDRLADRGGNPDEIEWVKSQIDDKPSYPLHQRLRELVDDLSPELRERIQARVAPLPTVLRDVMREREDIWHVMGKVRNNLGHGSKEHTDSQLRCLVRLAQTVTIGLALHQLRVSDTAVIDAIDHGQWSVI